MVTNNKNKEKPIKIFKVIKHNENKETRIIRDFYKGREMLSIRKFWRDPETGTPDWQPGKGVTFNYEDIEDIVEGLTLMKKFLEEEG